MDTNEQEEFDFDTFDLKNYQSNERENQEIETFLRSPQGKEKKTRKTAITTQELITFYKESGYNLKLNTLDDVIYKDNEPFNDHLLHVIKCKIYDHFPRSLRIEHAFSALMSLAYQNKYNPIEDYIESLPLWDQEDRIKQLASCFKPSGEFFRWLKHWLVGAIAKIKEGFQNPMLVLDGPQGIGKSYFARWLCPLENYFLSSAIYPDDKDCILRLTSTFIWEVEELGSTTRRQDIDALKAFLTKPSIRERRPWGKMDIIKQPIASFMGTVNAGGAGFLMDRTGNRRFLTTTIKKIDFNYTKIDKSQLWAQALFLYSLGLDSWSLTAKDIQVRDQINSNQLIQDPAEEIIKEKLVFTNNKEDFITATQLIDIIRMKGIPINRGTNMVVSSFILTNGGERIRKRLKKGGNKITCYSGVKLENT